MHLATAVALLRRPGLWGIAVVELVVLAQPGWWRRWPPLPRPDPAYLRFRLRTAYGDSTDPVAAGEVVEYLRWCRRMRRMGSPRLSVAERRAALPCARARRPGT